MQRGTVRIAMTALLTAVLIGGGVSAAQAATPDGCLPDPGYQYSNVVHNYIQMVPKNYGSGGTTVGISITAGASVTGTVGGSVSGDVSAIVAGAAASVNGSISYSMSASTTYSGSYTIPSSVSTGWIAAGANSDSMTWKHGSYNPSCSWVVDRSGTAKLPYHIPYFYHS